MTLILRPARREDGIALHAWRNDPAARAASLSSDQIPLSDHLRWFDNALADPDRQILIGCAPDPVGMVRFDRHETNITVSIALAPASRGRGLSLSLLQQAIDACRFPSLPLRATIRPENTVSLALFAKAGFQKAKDADPVVMIKETQ